jgi:hypothetical protein
MNRGHHLRKTLPQWLSLPFVDEIVITDWSSVEPVSDLRRLDSRVHVVRVEGEPVWMQTLPTNLAFARSHGDFIMKVDADCFLDAAIANYLPDEHRFYAGDWRSGEPLGKKSVNGQCVLTRAQFDTVNGYSELLRKYAYDDEDLYRRLQVEGYERYELEPGLFDFLPHTDDERLENFRTTPQVTTVDEFLESQLKSHQLRNIYISQAQPWGPHLPRASYTELRKEERLTVVSRIPGSDAQVSPEVLAAARLESMRHVAIHGLGVPSDVASTLDAAACEELLQKRLTGPG